MSNSRLESLKRFLEQEPNDSFTKYAIALEYAGMKEYQMAIAALKDLMEESPEYIPAYQQLGALYAQLERTNEAARTYERGIQIATKAGDQHAANEMSEAIDGLREN